MAYIQIQQSLRDHPKLHALAENMGWDDTDFAMGKLTRLWMWCVDYAESGDLRKFNDTSLAKAAMLRSDLAGKFVDALVASRWIDRSEGIFRIHDWWDFCGAWLRSKYKRSPQKWQVIRSLYKSENEALLEDTVEAYKQPSSNGYVTPKKRKEKKRDISIPPVGGSENPNGFRETRKPKPLSSHDRTIQIAMEAIDAAKKGSS